jgi:uncharacterized membrane protein
MAEGTARTEAFSDGIFAIAITLLVLEIHLPHEIDGEGLWHALAAQWPSYLAFTLSFFVILVTWINHHELLRLIHADCRRFQLANGLLMFYVAFVPFPTSVLASRLGGTDISAAVTFYCSTFFVGSLAWHLLFAVIVRDHLFRTEVDAQTIRHLNRSIWMGLAMNITAAVIAPVLPWLGLAITAGVRVFFLHLRYGAASPSHGLKNEQHRS